MPDMDGLTFVRHLRESCYSTPVIMLTSMRNRDEAR